MNKPPSPREIVEYLDAIYIRQSKPKKRLAIGLYNHFYRLYSNASEAYQENQPNNFCLSGPRGDGKKKLFSTIVAALKTPHTIYDCKEIKKFDVSQIAIKLWESALLLQKDDVPIEVEIQRSIVFLDNFHLIDESLDLDLSDLAMRLQLEFNAKKMKVQAKNLLFVYVVLPNKYPPYELFRVCDSPDYYPNHIGKTIETTYSCIYFTTQDMDMVGLSEPPNEIISRYRQDFALHDVALEFTHEAIVYMKSYRQLTYNKILDEILSLALYEIIGSDRNTVQVTVDSLELRQCPFLYKKQM